MRALLLAFFACLIGCSGEIQEFDDLDLGTTEQAMTVKSGSGSQLGNPALSCDQSNATHLCGYPPVSSLSWGHNLGIAHFQTMKDAKDIVENASAAINFSSNQGTYDPGGWGYWGNWRLYVWRTAVGGNTNVVGIVPIQEFVRFTEVATPITDSVPASSYSIDNLLAKVDGAAISSWASLNGLTAAQTTDKIKQAYCYVFGKAQGLGAVAADGNCMSAWLSPYWTGGFTVSAAQTAQLNAYLQNPSGSLVVVP